MPAYVMIDRLAVTDAHTLRSYYTPALEAVTGYGGRYVLPQRIEVEPLEGNWRPDRIVLIEFDDAAQAKRWWDSIEYAEARRLHHAATISNIILIDCQAVPDLRAVATEPPV